MVNAHHREGINTPITTGLFDNTIANTKDALLRMIRGNLSHTKLIFTLHP